MDLMQIADKWEKDDTHYFVDLPPMENDAWAVRHNFVSNMVQLQNLRRARDGDCEFIVTPDRTYVVLIDKKESQVMMSNTQMEYRTNRAFVAAAKGHVLVGGLGIGMLIKPLAAKDEVESITIIERDPSLISLVGPHYADVPKLRIFESDVFDFDPDNLLHRKPPGGKWDAIFMDIWPDVSDNNLPDMKKLKNRYRQFMVKGGYIECWSQKLCERMARRTVAFEKMLKTDPLRAIASLG